MRDFVVCLLIGLAAAVMSACRGGVVPAIEPVEVGLVATDMAFDQARIAGVAGRPLKISLQNEGRLEHDFSILALPYRGQIIGAESSHAAGHDMGNMDDQPAVHIAAQPGSAQSIQFTPTEAGEYAFYCAVAGHKEAGMAGTLVIAGR